MKFRRLTLKVKFILLLLLLLLTYKTPAQNSNLLNANSSGNSSDIKIKSLTESQIKYIQKSYSEKIQVPKELINGKEYLSYYTRSEFKPLLYVKKNRTAKLFTLTRQYNHLTLQYDTFLDEVIYTDPTQTVNYTFPQVALNKDIVYGFNLYFEDDSLIFKYFRFPECSKLNLKEGFYEIGYQGRSKFIIKHKSSYYQRNGLNEYKYSPEYYISTGDAFYKVKSKKSLIKLFGEKSGEMKKYIHESRIRMGQVDRNQFVEILKHYDSLFISSR